MTPDDLRTALAQTLADFRLTRGERRTLQQLFDEADAARYAEIRQQVFALARTEVLDPHALQILEWVEEVAKLLVPETPPTPLVEALFTPGEACTQRIVSLLGAVRTSLDICVFTITDDRLKRAIFGAKERGVTIRIISDNDKQHDLGSDIGELAACGIEVRTDRTPDHMHHKFALFDGRTLLTGSFNWTRAAEINRENIIVTTDPLLVRAFRDEFAVLWEDSVGL